MVDPATSMKLADTCEEWGKGGMGYNLDYPHMIFLYFKISLGHCNFNDYMLDTYKGIL